MNPPLVLAKYKPLKLNPQAVPDKLTRANLPGEIHKSKEGVSVFNINILI